MPAPRPWPLPRPGPLLADAAGVALDDAGGVDDAVVLDALALALAAAPAEPLLELLHPAIAINRAGAPRNRTSFFIAIIPPMAADETTDWSAVEDGSCHANGHRSYFDSLAHAPEFWQEQT
jgi:hypothetical protein